MNKIGESIGHFEKLPDEILLELFENYIRLIDLYLAFYPLNNCRINGILKSTRLYVDIPSKDIFHRESFLHFGPQIVSLHLPIFCYDLDLSKLVNLRLLHIEKPTRSQLSSIQARFLPNLNYLSLSPCWYSLEELPRYLLNIAQSCLFEHLRVCVLPNRKMIRFPPKHNQSPKLILQKDDNEH
jgi:hypothetical protein